MQKAEKSWGIARSRFLADTHALWQKDGDDGAPYCHRLPDGSWRAECRNQVFLTSTDAGGLAQLGLWLNETTGNTQLMLPVYLYACLFFFSFFYPLTLLMKQISKKLKLRYGMTI
ncbi:hypothetical protein [Undibacterium sp. TJN19]|uniref:hypothetical protein n=1 Tax=Undibacterium sp. TJN19 TaxID=3413055 RepID=UPI003BF18CE1